MAKNDLDKIRTVAAAIEEIFDVAATVEYPGFISIAEKFINDETQGSANAWACGPDSADGDEWTGNLLAPDGAVIGSMAFAVRPKSDDAADIASAIYVHGIGDLYTHEGCEPDAPCDRIALTAIPSHGARR